MNFTIKLAPHVSLTEMDGQTVLFSKSSGDFFGLNPTAAWLVKRLLQSDSLDATVRAAATDFSVPLSQIQSDLEEVVASLDEAGLVSKVALPAVAL